MNEGGSASFRTDLAKKAFESTFSLEKDLRATLKRCPPFAPEYEQVRAKLRKAYEDVIFLDFNFAHEQEVENLLWMKVHHKTIEAYRSRISKFRTEHGKSKPVEARKLITNFTNFIKEASKYYRNYIQRLIVHFKVTDLHYVLQTFRMELPANDPTVPSYAQELKDMVTRSCHGSLIYLGDLSRYRELQSLSKNERKNWGPALGYYQFARRLLPDAGSPMNQLAVIAVYSENTFNATYYFIRAICAVEEFPTARDNLNLGFKKIIAKRKTHDADMINLYMYLLAFINTTDKYTTVAADQSKFLPLLRSAITERLISSDDLTQLVSMNIGLWYIPERAIKDDRSPADQAAKLRAISELNLQVIATLLEVLRDEMVMIESVADDLVTQISPVIRRMLPALRVSSKWIKLNLLTARPLWTKYVSAMTLCGSKFPRMLLPAFTEPLAEDINMRGFKPLAGGLCMTSMNDATQPAHPNEQTLTRLSALLADAAEIAQQIDLHLSKEDSIHESHLLPSSNAHHAEIVGASESRTSLGPSHSKLAEIARGGGKLDARKPTLEGSVSHASEPSMSFSLNQMVDSIVGHANEDEEIIFKGRRPGLMARQADGATNS